MAKQNSSSPAFPTCVSADSGGGLNHGEPGMSLRTWVATQVMVGLLACETEGNRTYDNAAGTAAEHRARYAVAQADALLAELAK